GTNYGLRIEVANANYNIALKVKGNVAVDGALTSTNLYKFIPGPLPVGNALSVKTSNTAIVLVDNASIGTVYLPTVDDVVNSLGLNPTADFAIRYTVVAHFNSLDYQLASNYDMRDSDGNIISFVNMARGDQTYWL